MGPVGRLAIEPDRAAGSRPSAYPPIADLAIIGNGQTAALVDRSGAIVWCCWPRFDSPAVFCSLLDARRGGHFTVAPKDRFDTTRRYIEETNVLETTFSTGSGIMSLTDLMPAPDDLGNGRGLPHRILRRVECHGGEIELAVEFAPTFDFARASGRLQSHPRGALATGPGGRLSLVSPVALSERGGTSLTGGRRLRKGDALWFILSHGPARDAPRQLETDAGEADDELERTVGYWRDWSRRCEYVGPHRDLVLRSALALKLLVFQPSGSLIAAPTTSLPAEIGGERNWDYRFTWLRDAGLVLDALQQLGYHRESMRFIEWLENLCQCGDRTVQILYALDGSPAPAEETLGHLDGYCRSRPVRTGNGAVAQIQNDVYGHVLDAVLLCYERMPRRLEPQLWDLLRRLTDAAAAHWNVPDHGPWEIRGPRRHYLYSKLYCWAGLDRAIRFAERLDLPGNLERWRRERAALREAVLTRGYDAHVGAFKQSFEGMALDASALTIPLVGFLPASDERVRSTVRLIRERLVEEGLVYRYRMDDGLAGSDATFTLCSFWLVSNLALCGDGKAAAEHFAHVCGFANDLGLLSEQIDPRSGAMLGNFPQGFAHLGLIRAALHLQDLDSRERSR